MLLKFVTRLFWGEKLEWYVNLTPEQVLNLVRSKNEGSWLERTFVPGIGVSTGKQRFTLAKMNIGNLPMSANSFCHVLSGRIYSTQNGSRVVARFRLAIPVFIFTSIWLGLLFAVGIFGGISSLFKAVSMGNFDEIVSAFILFAIPVLGTAFLNLFRLAGVKKNEEDLRAALISALGVPWNQTSGSLISKSHQS